MHMSRVIVASFTFLVFGFGQSPDPMKQGAAAFRAGRYAEAVNLFEHAVRLSPNDPNTYVQLGIAWLAQYRPGDQSEANKRIAASATSAFGKALQIQPDNKQAMESLASLHFARASSAYDLAEKLYILDESGRWFQKLIDYDPSHKVAYYNLGVIAWSKFYPELMSARARLGMRPEDPGPLRDSSIRSELRSRMSHIVDDGIRHLERALQLDPAYDDAMAYLNLLVRERADLLDTVEEYTREVAIADQWVQRALETKKAKSQQISATLSGMPQRGPLTGGIYPPPPPPPPAPPPPSIEVLPQRITVGGGVQDHMLIERPIPAYPPEAKAAKVEGKVRMKVLILKDGTVGEVTLMEGHPLLAPTAIGTVKQYRYRPTVLNGAPVEVITQVDMNFTLAK